MLFKISWVFGKNILKKGDIPSLQDFECLKNSQQTVYFSPKEITYCSLVK